jgi:hypothetical protein
MHVIKRDRIDWNSPSAEFCIKESLLYLFYQTISISKHLDLIPKDSADELVR